MAEKPEMTGAEVAAKIAALEAEVAALKAKSKSEEPQVERRPWPKYDPTEGMTMSPSAMKPMVDLIPSRKSQPGFNAHAWAQTKGPGEPGGFGAPQPVGGPGKAVERGTGWQNPIPLESPPGVKHVDRIAEHFAALDKLEMVRRFSGK